MVEHFGPFTFEIIAIVSSPRKSERSEVALIRLHKKRNEIERLLFRKLKGFKRVATRYDKLDVVFIDFIYFAFIADTLK